MILDGNFELDNGVRVLGASGVAVENLTAQNYTNNGLFWTAVDGYRASYITAYRNGDYGVYTFDSVNGLFEHSYASGSPDAGFYIGQCFECNAVMDDVIAEYNGLGYSGTTSGGNLYIINSRFNNNRAGINTNSATYELCYPQRQTTIVGNLVYDNNQADTPAIDDAILAMNNGILVEGGIGNVIERNLVYGHDKVGIGLIPFAEFEPNDVEPSSDMWDKPCSETRDLPLADPADIEAIFWKPMNNRVVGNVTEDNGVADIALSALNSDLSVVDPTTLGNCFSDNVHTTSAPADLEGIVPCEGEGNGADYLVGDLGIVSWLTDAETAPPSVDYPTARHRHRPLLEGMPDAATAPARPGRQHAADGRHHDHRRADKPALIERPDRPWSRLAMRRPGSRYVARRNALGRRQWRRDRRGRIVAVCWRRGRHVRPHRSGAPRSAGPRGAVHRAVHLSHVAYDDPIVHPDMPGESHTTSSSATRGHCGPGLRQGDRRGDVVSTVARHCVVLGTGTPRRRRRRSSRSG